MDSKKPDSGQIVSLSEFRNKKSLEKELAGERTPLYVSHLDGKLKGSPHFKRGDAEDFGDRLTRIRASLERINQLMAEIKKTSGDAKEKTKADSSLKTLH